MIEPQEWRGLPDDQQEIRALQERAEAEKEQIRQAAAERLAAVDERIRAEYLKRRKGV